MTNEPSISSSLDKNACTSAMSICQISAQPVGMHEPDHDSPMPVSARRAWMGGSSWHLMLLFWCHGFCIALTCSRNFQFASHIAAQQASHVLTSKHHTLSKVRRSNESQYVR